MKRLLMIVVLLSMILGCSFNKPQGPLFEPHTIKDNEKAFVYVYRPPGERFGHNRTYYLFDGKSKVTDLKHGGYFLLEAEPGKVSLVSDVNDSAGIILGGLLFYAIEKAKREKSFLEFEVQSGETYYIRFKPITHATYFEPTLTLVTKNVGMKEISECKLILK